MHHGKTAIATLRVGLGGARPTDLILQVRVRCWLARVACLIERRDTPVAPAGRRDAPVAP